MQKNYFTGKWKDGYRVIQEKSGGKYKFEDRNGNLSEEYALADDYSNSYALVQFRKNGKCFYRDIEGNLSDGYAFATTYENGVATVRETNSSECVYRDVLGRTGITDASVGGLKLILVDYYEGAISINDIPVECFDDYRCKDWILKVYRARMLERAELGDKTAIFKAKKELEKLSSRMESYRKNNVDSLEFEIAREKALLESDKSSMDSFIESLGE